MARLRVTLRTLGLDKNPLVAAPRALVALDALTTLRLPRDISLDSVPSAAINAANSAYVSGAVSGDFPRGAHTVDVAGVPPPRTGRALLTQPHPGVAAGRDGERPRP